MKRKYSNREIVGFVFLLALAIHGALDLGPRLRKRIDAFFASGAVPFCEAKPSIPISRMPGPERPFGCSFILPENVGELMIGENDPDNERWADIAGNFYSRDFVSKFSYESDGEITPKVRVVYLPKSGTFSGRLEARDLKPNFAYQMKLLGLWEDREGFENIGYTGRWRLPGRGTNYTDKDYENYEDKDQVEAYILFDYFVTDSEGNACRDFNLDSCLHVLWSASRQRRIRNLDDRLLCEVDASSRKYYSNPKVWPSGEYLWAERERSRYSHPDELITLPTGKYKCLLILTEESFHSKDNDGGFWATVMSLPVEFEVEAAQKVSKKD